MITFHGVTKDYDGHIALNHLDLTIEDGQIVGLIGHNGAGKSTTIKSLVSVITPTTGTIEVDGQDLYSHRLAIKKKIGYVADSPDLFLRLTANEFWELVATSYDMSQKDCDQRLEELLTIFDFQSHRLKQMMRQHADRGKTVIFSTHVLEVAEQLCDKIAILKKGNLIFYGTIEELKSQHPEQSLESIYLSLAGRKEEGGDHAS